MEDRCITCGDVIPEGRQICPKCENAVHNKSKLYCWFKAIPLWLRTGLFVPHLYESTYEDAIIIANDNGFRVSDNYNHSDDEVVYPHAVLERFKCVFCGHETLAWYAGKEDVK